MRIEERLSKIETDVAWLKRLSWTLVTGIVINIVVSLI